MRSAAKVLVALVFAAVAAAPALAQPAYLVKDIDPPAAGTGVYPDSRPAGLFAALGKVFFLAGEPSAGREVWVTDGTAAGTQLLADACPGICSPTVHFLASAGGIVYWATADDDFGPWLLWRSDGTRAGTFILGGPQGDLQILLPGFDPIPEPLASSGYAPLGRLFFFTGCRETIGCGLWRSDGTAAGTVELQTGKGDISDQLTAWRGELYYFTSNDSEVPVLWKSDGTVAGTVEILTPSSVQQVLPRLITALPDRLLFVAAQDGDELWASDGTAAGTRPITDFAAPAPFDATETLVVLGGRAYFVADDVTHGAEIWTTDGTAAGTRRITDIGFHAPFEVQRQPQMALVGSHLVFVASDGITSARLWATDGTPASTAPISDVLPTSESAFVAVGGRVVFAGAVPSLGTEIWATDGTPAGTAPLADICAGSCSSIFVPPLPFLDKALFVAQDADSLDLWTTDGTAAGTRRFTRQTHVAAVTAADLAFSGGTVLFSNNPGGELWKSDGTAAGTAKVADLAHSAPSSFPGRLTSLVGRLVFAACDRAEGALWLSDGSDESTSPIAGTSFPEACIVTTAAAPGPLPVAGGGAFFFDQRQLWRTDGTAAGTFPLTHFAAPDELTGAVVTTGRRAFFELGTTDGSSGRELWRSDGTPAGTAKAIDMPAEAVTVDALTAVGDAVYFRGYDQEAGAQTVWRSDGTAAGTVRLLSVPDYIGFYTTFARVGSRDFLWLLGGGTGSQLWTTDGTLGGTALVATFGTGQGFGAEDVGAFGGSLYFFAFGSTGQGLWRSDGTAAGTLLVRSFEASLDGSLNLLPSEYTALGDHLYFVADEGLGRQLWRTDGTPAGTAKVRDFLPGSVSELTAFGDRLFFVADDGVHGFELWESDGTAAGTRLAQDIAPGPASSHPTQLTVAGDRLYFAADDGLHGSELWALPRAAATPANGCQPSPAHLCLAGGRFQVEAEWRDFQGNPGRGTAVALTGDTGYFWFFSPANVEVVAKVLDGRGVNGAFWVFYGALSSVEYTLTVTDTLTGLTRRYENPSGQLASVGDTAGFGPLGAFETQRAAPAAAASKLDAHAAPRVAIASCAGGSTTLCLEGDRFAVTATWKDFQGRTGVGTAVALTGDTGYFWFFDPASVEVVTKVLDGRPVNGKFWLFYGALSSVDYTLTVTDTTTGATRTYHNASGNLASAADTSAF